MVGSDIGEINRHVGSRAVWQAFRLLHVESAFRDFPQRYKRFDQAASASGELEEAVPDRGETDKVLHMSLTMVWNEPQ